jgi:hypothetical protein
LEDFKFEVGEKYENMKGFYTVLSIDGDRMHICWESGEERMTTKSFQRRVMERMQFEREREEKARMDAENAAKRRAAGKTSRKRFEGLTEEDFAQKVSGTTWRTRQGLGGAVRVSPESDAQDIRSWAVSRKPMVHWADIEHHNIKGRASQANFFAAIDDADLTFGWMLERSSRAHEEDGDWQAFLNWLRDAVNEDWLKKTVADQNLKVAVFRNGAQTPDTVMAVDGQWRVDDPEQGEALQSLADFLEALPVGAPLDVQIAERLSKEDAIARQSQIARDLERLFTALLPLYKGAAKF